jgi:glycosyltransferase involved in cell wall biosynthesis
MSKPIESQPGLVSVVMPVRNAERWVCEAIDSLLAQSYKHWELLVVDDGSTDGTFALLKAYTDPRVRCFRQVHAGVSSARNWALDAARGEFVTLLDGDDWLPPDSLSQRVQYLRQHPEVDIVDGVKCFMDEKMQRDLRRHVPAYKGLLLPRLKRLDSSVFTMPFFMFRRERAAHIRFEPTMRHAEDQLFYLRLAGSGRVRIGFVDTVVYLYRVHTGSAMSNLDGIDVGYQKLVAQLHSIKALTLWDRFYLRAKLAKVMALSRRHHGQYLRALTSAARILFTRSVR